MSSKKSFYTFNNLTLRMLHQKTFIFERRCVNEVMLFSSFNKFSSFSDSKILEVFLFLEKLCGQKPVISKFSDSYVGSKRQYSLSFKVTVSKKRMASLLFYLRFCGMPNEIRRFGAHKLVKGQNFYEFSFKDWGIFHGLNATSSISSVRLRLKGSKFFLNHWLLLNGFFIELCK